MDDYTQVVVLCEDRQQEVFARHFLAKCGVNRRRIQAKVAPLGLGAAEQYVRNQYPAEVREYRVRCNHLNIALVVMLDADAGNVAEHLKELENSLRQMSMPPRQPDEKIGIFVPKRNIETWIHYLQGKAVNEIDEYPRFTGNEGACKPWVEKLAKDRHVPLREDAPPSLRAACDELPRIL